MLFLYFFSLFFIPQLTPKLFSTRFDRHFGPYFSPFTIYNAEKTPLKEGIALGTPEGGLQIINIDSGDMDWENLLKDRHEEAPNLVLEIPKTNLIFSCDSHDVRIWDFSSRRLVSITPHINKLQYTKAYVDPTEGSSQIYLLSQGTLIEAFDYKKLIFKKVFTLATPITFTIQDFFIFDAKTLLVAQSNFRVVAYNVDNAQAVKTFVGDSTAIRGHTRAVNYLTFLKKENKLLTLGGDLLAILWDYETATPIKQFSGFPSRFSGLLYIEGK